MRDLAQYIGRWDPKHTGPNLTPHNRRDRRVGNVGREICSVMYFQLDWLKVRVSMKSRGAPCQS